MRDEVAFGVRGVAAILILLLGFGCAGPAATENANKPARDARTVGQLLAEEEFVKAAEKLRSRADSGDNDARFILGFLHHMGLGVPLSRAQASALHSAATSEGHAWSRFFLEGMSRGGGAERKPSSDLLPPGWLEVTPHGFQPNFSRALAWLKPRAEAGDREAMAALAYYSIDSRGDVFDPTTYIGWLRKAADLGHAESAFTLSTYHEEGTFVPGDQSKALAYLTRAAEEGLNRAQYGLAVRIETKPNITDEEFRTAFRWYNAAAEGGNVNAMLRVSEILLRGERGISRDQRAATEMTRRAAATGNLEAMTELGRMLIDEFAIAADKEDGLRLIRAAAEQGDPDAQRLLGFALTRIQYGDPDFAQAAHWYRKAAAQGSEGAQRELVMVLENQVRSPDALAEAFSWRAKFAAAGDGKEQAIVGRALLEGTGVAKNWTEAFRWFALAAQQGVADGWLGMGECHEFGTGAEADVEKMLACYRRAAELGSPKGGVALANFILRTRETSADLIRECTLLLQASAPQNGIQQTEVALGRILLLPSNPMRDEAAGIAYLERHLGLVPMHYVRVAVYHLRRGDAAKARALLARASELRVPMADVFMGLVCVLGLGGPVEEERGAKLLQGNSETPAIVLSYLHFRGVGVPVDIEKAMYYAYRAPHFMSRTQTEAGWSMQNERRLAHVFAQRPPSSTAPGQLSVGQSRPARVAIASPEPIFPFLARALDIGGTAVIAVEINAEGRASSHRVASASLPVFGEAALEAVKQWHFGAAMVDGKPIASKLEVPVDFVVPDEPNYPFRVLAILAKRAKGFLDE